jgi:hypothetical protein
VLIRRDVLDRIAAGEIDTVFRRQRRPTVRTGGTLRTAVGVLDIVEVAPIRLDEITLADARRAGFADVDAVVTDLCRRTDGDDYRIRVGLGGPDPRLALREDDQLDRATIEEIAERLDRLDRASRRGPWTRSVLALIAERPHVRAPDLAASMDRDTASFKNDVRKLKALGLTISHSPGYELSPRGRAFLATRSDDG